MYKNITKQLGIPPGYIYKILLIMRLTTVLLIATIMQVSAGSFAQKISLNEKNAPLEKIFDKIRLQSGYDFLFNRELLKTAKPVDINIKNADIEDALAICFKGQPFTYTLEEKTIVIKEKTPSFLERVVDRLAVIDVHGRVVDQKGKPLPGATVKVKSTGKSVSTNAKGEFYLEKIEEDAVVVISFIGYVSKEVNAKREMGEVILELSNSKLDEIQVIAYGTTTRRLSTGNVSTIKADEIGKQPVNNPLLALQGRVPGLFITQSSGISGSGVTVRIQGVNSLESGNDPLYVIDGMPYISQLMPTISDVLGTSGNTSIRTPTGSGNPLSYINPNDIESIDILKDADATSIYGSRAANGAILITTKKGIAGNTKVDINTRQGIGQVGRKLNLLNTQQYLEIRKDAFKNDGAVADENNAPDLFLWDQGKYTDWQEKFIGNNASYTDVDARISGGSNNTQFTLGSTYHREMTVFPSEFSDQKVSLQFSISNMSANKKFKVQLTGFYLFDKNQLPQSDLTNLATGLAPNAPDIYNQDGTLNWAPNSLGSSTWSNPYKDYQNSYNLSASNLNLSGILSYELLPGLSVKNGFGFSKLSSNELLLSPLTSNPPEDLVWAQRSFLNYSSAMNSWQLEPEVNFIQKTKYGNFDILLGSTIQQRKNDQLQIFGSGYSSDLQMRDLKSAPFVFVLGNYEINYKYTAIFGRFNYNWKDKYIVNLTSRRDGSSRFGANNMFHNFWAIGAAWLVTNESFFKDRLGFLSFGKLRGSYGTTGNDQIGDYQYLNLYDTFSVGIPYQGITSLSTNSLPNPYLAWEETKKAQLGIDLGFLENNLLLNIGYFNNKSSNQLSRSILPRTTGFTSITENLPATIQNSGIEISLVSNNVKNKMFQWTSNFNFTKGKNKLSSFKNLVNSAYVNQLIVGQPISIRKLFRYLYVDNSTGGYLVADKNGIPTTSPTEDDRAILIDPSPKYFGGFQNIIKYRDFELDFLFQFAKQIGPNYLYQGYLGEMHNSPSEVFNIYWRQPNDNALFQRPNQDYSLYQNFSNVQNSDVSYTDASYIKLKNVSLGYSVPISPSHKKYFQRARFFVQGQNILTFTKYKGFDPETLSAYKLPPLRILAVGCQLTL